MEELERRLNSNNPFIVAQIISTLMKNIQGKSSASTETPQLNFLKQKCLDNDPLICEVACTGVIKLVENGVLELNSTLTDFITTIPTTKCYSSLTKLIGHLVYLELEEKTANTKNYICNYNLTLPKHPFLALLNANTQCENEILNEIKYFYICRNDRCAYFGSELFRAVYVYSICNPGEINLNLFKQKLWTFLINYDKLQSTNVIIDLLCWMNIQNKTNLQLNSDFLIEILSINDSRDSYETEILLLWLTSILHHLIEHKLDPRFTINCLIKTITEFENDLTVVNCLLVMLTKTIKICSPIYLLDLLQLCELLTENPKVQKYALNIVKSSLLQWIASPSDLFSNAYKIAIKIYNFIENFKKPNQNEAELTTFFLQHQKILMKNASAFLSIKLCLLYQQWNNPSEITNWLEHLNSVPHFFIKQILHFLYGLFIQENTNNETVVLKTFFIIEKCVQHNINITSEFLIIILHKLSNTTNTELHFALLRALPKMAVFMENFQKVVSTIQALSEGPDTIKNFSTLMMFEAWKINNKCYPALEKLLLNKCNSGNKLETYTTKAYILKELCDKRPELYGKDMVAHLSKILNECKDAGGSLPCALAIEGIQLLCKVGVIDVITTWAHLEPMFRDDTRVPVIKSLCNLIHEIPHFPYNEAYTEEYLNKVVKKLWDYVITSHNTEVIQAALMGLTSFSLEQISLQIPDLYLSAETFELRKKTADHLLFKIPGETWLNLLEKLNKKINMIVVGDFLIKMVAIEVSGYHKYIYQVKGSKEPLGFNYLPSHSVVRTVGEFIRTQSSNWKNKKLVYLECLRIFSQEYSKPLPPLDWNFIQELSHEPEIKYFCIDITSHQVILSGSARRFMENYILAVTENCNNTGDIFSIYKNLKHLANSIQRVILQPFFETSLIFAINLYKKDKNKDLLKQIVDQFVAVLGNKEILDTNKTTISQVVTDILFATEESSELFYQLLKCLTVFPVTFLNEMINSSKITEDKIIVIRCSLAISSNIQPLNWLNNLIENEDLFEKKNLILTKFVTVFQKHSDKTESALWLLDLIGQIQTNVAQRSSKNHITHLFEVFMLAVITFSGYSIFMKDIHLEELKHLFPQAFATLLNHQHWSICTTQALEWLYHMNSDEIIPKEYRNIFGHTLQSLRHDEEFTKNMKWIKYMNCRTDQS